VAKGTIVLFQNVNCEGDSAIYEDSEGTAHVSDKNFNDRTSSFIVVKGHWQLYQDANYQKAFPGVFGPGVYTPLEKYNVKNDSVSSIKCLDLSEAQKLGFKG
jgi:hypothetical protein